MKRYLVLEDGSYFEGEAIGASSYRIGELVFNTSMSGYQEILTDPSCSTQIVMMTYPLIGGYGINRDDNESLKSYVFGFIVKDSCEFPSNFRSEETLNEYLTRQNIPGIADIDTRSLTRKIRNEGIMKASFCDTEEEIPSLVNQLKEAPDFHDTVSKVSTKNVYPIPGRGRKVVVVDFGVKLSILRELSERGCDITVVPYNTSAEEIMSYYPDGVIFSNGPGNPEDLPVVLPNIEKLIPQTVVFGIDLGYQLIALACGAKTEKMKYGQHGDVPVRILAEDRVVITVQNHNYMVNADSLKETRLEMTYQSINDGVCEGFRHLDCPCFGVQFHPEANAGPHDCNGLFDDFMAMMEKEDKENA